MQSRRDSSVLRSLALSFGEGLAFSVGMKLTQGSGARLKQVETRVPAAEHPRQGSQRIDKKVIHAIVSALETRLAEHSGQVDRRLAGLESAISETVASRVEQES